MKENEKKTVLRAPKPVELKSSLQSIKEYRALGEQKHYYYVRIILLITDIISLGLGIYILLKKNKFLDNDFKHHKLLLSFVYIFPKCYWYFCCFTCFINFSLLFLLLL